MRESPRDRRIRSFAARVGQDSGRSAPCVQPNTPDGHHRENVRSARDVLPRSVQFSVATNVRFSVAIDMSWPARPCQTRAEHGPGARSSRIGTRTSNRIPARWRDPIGLRVDEPYFGIVIARSHSRENNRGPWYNKRAQRSGPSACGPTVIRSLSPKSVVPSGMSPCFSTVIPPQEPIWFHPWTPAPGRLPDATRREPLFKAGCRGSRIQSATFPLALSQSGSGLRWITCGRDIQRLRQTEVPDLEGPILPNLDVGGFQVLDDTGFVSGSQGFADLLRDRALADPIRDHATS